MGELIGPLAYEKRPSEWTSGIHGDDPINGYLQEIADRLNASSERPLILLMVTVLISEQHGTSKDHVIGVFGDPKALRMARESTERFYRMHRYVFTEIPLHMNVPIAQK
ncbi:MAG TPA: hypothetical protein VGV14_02900 [Rhodanobacter sp.]|nr:hypothetical protein [Rhodanobacter sp.]